MTPQRLNATSLRQEMAKRRETLTREEGDATSHLIEEQFKAFFLKSSVWKNRKVALYRSLPTELNLEGIQSWLSAAGADIFLPRINNKAIEMVHVASPAQTLWHKGTYGIDEPPLDLKATHPELLDVIFVPGVAFGPKGERIGRGGGYYDRFLSHARHALRVALAFDFQIYPSLEQKAWDQPVHWILTEKQDIRMPRAADWLKEVAVK